MPSLYKQEELEQVKQICEHWLKYFAPKDYTDDIWNRDLMMTFIKYKCGGEVTTENLNAACKANHADLHGLGVAHTPSQIAAKAKEEAERKKAEEVERNYAEQTQVVQTWLSRHCPEGLKGPNGEPFPGDQDRLVAFVLKNHGGKFSIDALNNAVEVLSPVLTWFSSDPADREIRNKPVTPRKLSRQAMIDAGLLPLEPERPSHAKTDGNLKSPEDLIRFMAKEELLRKGVTSSPIMAEADAIVVQNRRGRVDAGKTAEVRKIIVYSRPGVIDEIRTLQARNKAAEKYERDKNQI